MVVAADVCRRWLLLLLAGPPAMVRPMSFCERLLDSFLGFFFFGGVLVGALGRALDAGGEQSSCPQKKKRGESRFGSVCARGSGRACALPVGGSVPKT